MEARGSVVLFLGYCFFPKCLYVRPYRASSGSCLFHHSLGSCPGFVCAAVVGVIELQQKRKQWKRVIEQLPSCHCAPASARVTHLPVDFMPPCPDAAGKPHIASVRGHWVQREPVGEDSLVRLLGRQMLMHSLEVLKVQSWSDRLLLSGGYKSVAPSYPLFTQPVMWDYFTWTY